MDGVMERITAQIVCTLAVDTTGLQCIENTDNNGLLVLATLRIDGQNVHQVLPFVVLFLYNLVICCLLDQGQEKQELFLIQSILHRQHIVVAIVENQVGDTLLASMNRHSKS